MATIGPRVDEVLMMKFSLSSELPSGAVVKSVYSLPIQVTCNVDALEEVGVSSDNVLLGVGEQLQPTCVRDVSIRGTNFYVFECQASMGIAGKVWDSTYVLLEYLSSHRDLVAGKSIVELGSGTGLAGLAMSTLEPRSLILTDLPDVVPLLSANIQFNALQLGSPLGTLIRESFSCRPHGWGNMDEIEGLRGEVVVASDVVYDPVGYQPLVDSLQALLAPVQGRPAPICILAHRHRHPEDSRYCYSDCCLHCIVDLIFCFEGFSRCCQQCLIYGLKNKSIMLHFLMHYKMLRSFTYITITKEIKLDRVPFLLFLHTLCTILCTSQDMTLFASTSIVPCAINVNCASFTVTDRLVISNTST